MRDITFYMSDICIYVSDNPIYLSDIRIYMSDITSTRHENTKKLLPKFGQEFFYATSAEVFLFSVRVTK